MVKQVADYIDKVQEKFPILSKSELNKIITYGLKIYAYVNQKHCDVLIKNLEDEPMIAHCGTLGYDSLKHYQRWVTKWRMKSRMISQLKKEKWDGYYYIGLTEAQHKALKKGSKHITFQNIYMTKLLKELYHTPYLDHIWRVPWIEDCGWKFFLPKLRTNKAEYIGKNKYAKYHQCFLERYAERHASTDQQSAESNGRAECNNDNL